MFTLFSISIISVYFWIIESDYKNVVLISFDIINQSIFWHFEKSIFVVNKFDLKYQKYFISSF